MSKQVVNTEGIALAAGKLKTCNNKIDSEFNTLVSKSRQLDNNWKSAGGDIARRTLQNILKNNDDRTKTIQNYVNMLQQQVDPGYRGTETKNIKLADKFK